MSPAPSNPAPEPLVPDSADPQPAEPGTPLYVHLPYCVAKCTYCDFFSIPAEGHDADAVLETVLEEARLRAPRSPRTVFLGGGTPSIHGTQALTSFLERLHELTGFRDSAREVTLESNPESLDEEKARALLGAGVDRLSIGFQSLEAGTLELFGRVHSAAESLRAFDAARRAGFRRLSVDLISAVPGQTAARWEAELRQVLALRPDHLSAYNLAFEEGTPFQAWLQSGRLERLDEELELELFELTRRVTSELGYEAYEVSNFSLSEQQCLHNVNYWRNGPYVGLGPSAVSKVGLTRFGNPRSIRAWTAAVRRGQSGGTWSETLPPERRLGETWWLGLRLAAGVDPAAAREAAAYGTDRSGDDDDPALGLARELGQDGWLVERHGRWCLSPRGLALADAIAARFLARCEAPEESRSEPGAGSTVRAAALAER